MGSLRGIRGGGGTFSSTQESVRVSSAEYRVHTAMMGGNEKEGGDEKQERPVRNH